MAEIHNPKYIFLSRLVIAPAIISLLAAPRVAFCEENVTPIVYPEGALILSILMLFVLGWFFYLVFRWSTRNEQASYLGGIYKDTVLEFEFNRLKVRVVQELHEGKFRREAIETLKTKWEKEGINFKGPSIPEELQKYIHKGHALTGGLGSSGSTRDGGYGGAPGYGGCTTLDDGQSEYPWEDGDLYLIDWIDASKITDKNDLKMFTDLKKEKDKYINKKKEWNQQLKIKQEELYHAALNKVRGEAEKSSDRAADFDISIFRGRGPTFVLEFTAIVVIIFSAVILGILTILKAEQIGTLLAAVAGYVLGRSTNPGSNNEPSKEKEKKNES